MARKFLDYTGVSYLWQKIVAELNKKANNQDLATVATSGSYNDLINKPAIPTKVSDLQDDSGHYIKPVGGIPAQDLAETYLTQHQDISGKANSADLAAVATSGSYNDLLNKPFIPSAVSDLTDDSGHYTKPVSGIPASDLAAGVLDIWSGLTYHTSTMSTDSDSFILGGATDAPTEINKCLVTSTPAPNVIPKFDYQGRLHSTTPEEEWDGSNRVATTEYVDNMISDNMPEIPTNVSELNNDAGYLTSFTETDPTVPSWAKAAQKPSYTAAEVGAPTVQEMNTAIGTAIGNINSFDMAVVQELPSQDISTHTIYLVPKTGETNDVYDEYVYINSNWEMVGNTQIDLSNYATKSEIPTVPVQDVQVNGSSIINAQGIAEIPFAGNNGTSGLVKLNVVNTGVGVNNNGELNVVKANSSNIKNGTNTVIVAPVSLQHEAAFYGLAKAAGDSTQSQSDNAVGTYTNDAKSAIQSMLGVPSADDMSDKVDKTAIDNAGITSYTYNTKFGGEFSVTTATTSGWLNPYARASVTGRIDKAKLHRVIINGTEYMLRTKLWYSASNGNVKVYEYLGNIGLYISSTSGVPGEIDNVPFVIISDINNSSSIDVLTSAAGTYAITVEEMTPTQKVLPKSLVWDDEYVPIEKNNNGGTYNGFSIGVNQLNNQRGTVAIGYGNKISNEFGVAIGTANTVESRDSFAIGTGNTLTSTNAGHSNYIEGYLNQATGIGQVNHIEGMNNTCNVDANNLHVEGAGNVIAHRDAEQSHVEGFFNTASAAITHVEGYKNISNCPYEHVQGTFNCPGSVYSNWTANTHYNVNDRVVYNYKAYACVTENTDATFTAANWRGLPSKGTNAFTIGNGLNKNNRSNAMLVDWDGNAKFKGDVYVHANADSSGGTKLATVNDIPEVPVQDVQVNGDSVVSNGIANVPIGSSSTFGVFKTEPSFGITVNDSGKLYTYIANTNEMKAGSQAYKPIVPATQHTSTFYGLAKAAGDATQASSDNAVGTYTAAAKTAIRAMLGATSSNVIEVSDTQPTDTDNKIWMPETAPAGIEVPTYAEFQAGLAGKVSDVQINGSSIVANNVANIPMAANKLGVVYVSSNPSYGLTLGSSTGVLQIAPATDNDIKGSAYPSKAICSDKANVAAFYGLAYAAGDTTMASSSNAVGTYTSEAKAAIQSMLGINLASIASEVEIPLVETVTGTTPTITGEPNTRYNCGEVSTISITPPASGSIVVIFESGSTAAVLTVPNTVKWPTWFDATTLETDTIYEILITDGVYGSVMTWAS